MPAGFSFSTQEIEAMNHPRPTFVSGAGRTCSDDLLCSIADDDMKPVGRRWNKRDLITDVTAGEPESDEFNRAEWRGPTPADQNHRGHDRNPHTRPPKRTSATIANTQTTCVGPADWTGELCSGLTRPSTIGNKFCVLHRPHVPSRDFFESRLVHSAGYHG